MKLFSPLKLVQNKIFVSKSRQICFIVILKSCCLKNVILLTFSQQSSEQHEVFITAIIQFVCSIAMPLDNIVTLLISWRWKYCMMQHSLIAGYVWDVDQWDFTVGGATQCDIATDQVLSLTTARAHLDIDMSCIMRCHDSSLNVCLFVSSLWHIT